MADRSSIVPKVTNYEVEDTSDGRNDDDVSDVSGMSVGAGSKRSSPGQSAFSSSSKKSRKSASRKVYSLVEDSIVAAIIESNEAANLRMMEISRHNKVMESIETKKAKWKGKNEELEYKMNLLAKFESMKDRGWSDKRIVRFYPDMKQVVKASEDTGTSSEEEN
eukprot:scaffold333_cov133-Cylindrotheca_fusiformis.AAC.24